MGERLVPSLQAREAIATLLVQGDSKAIGTPPDWWAVRVTREKADGGDAYAMYELGQWFEEGKKGLPKDFHLAYLWNERSAKAGDTDGLAKQGVCLFRGIGVAKKETEGAILLGMAADRGCPLAAFILGMAYYKGKPASSIGKNLDRAQYWLNVTLQRGSSCTQCLCLGDEDEAEQALEAIREELAVEKK
jgi:TPR repeat protein